MSNQDYDAYIERTFGKVSPRCRRGFIKTMAKYGDNHWWESENPLVIAKHQIFERKLIVPYDFFMRGLAKLLGRPVGDHELGLNAKGLRKEAELALKRLEQSMGISPEQKEEEVSRGLSLLQDYANRNGAKYSEIDSFEEDAIGDILGLDD
ncbi:MAG: hypothetical protein PHF67_02415 [Candidatus Nanoarchaeia archaeon]|nr:hypothetical protein [Candidatus Nanoarchaeia archaeon]